MSKHLSLVFHSDPAHGWLQVDRDHITDLGLLYRISCASYVSDCKVYLEEDCDMPLFLDAAEQFEWSVCYDESHSNTLTTIRNLPRYEPPASHCSQTQQVSRQR